MEQIAELSDLINYRNYVDDNEDVLFFADFRIVNKRWNTDQSYSDPFWNAMVRVVDMDGDGANILRHTKGGDLETTTNISYVPLINSIAHIIEATVELL